MCLGLTADRGIRAIFMRASFGGGMNTGESEGARLIPGNRHRWETVRSQAKGTVSI